MGLTGKLIGGGLGWLLGGPMGAVIGGVIGHFVKDAALPGALPEGGGGAQQDPRVRQQQEELYFVASLVGICTAMIRADGDVHQEEVRAIRRFFQERLGYRGESLEIVRDLIKQFLRQGVDLDALCLDVSRRSDYATRLLLVECLLDVALADGVMHPQEQVVFARCVQLLGISAVDLENLTLRAGGAGATRGTGGGGGTSRQQAGGTDYSILGVSREASEQDVKRAYRELVKKYHPDRVAHLGDEFRDLAHRKFVEIQEAYDRVKLARGWS